PFHASCARACSSTLMFRSKFGVPVCTLIAMATEDARRTAANGIRVNNFQEFIRRSFLMKKLDSPGVATMRTHTCRDPFIRGRMCRTYPCHKSPQIFRPLGHRSGEPNLHSKPASSGPIQQPDAGPMTSSDLFDDRQTQPRAFAWAAGNSIEALE